MLHLPARVSRLSLCFLLLGNASVALLDGASTRQELAPGHPISTAGQRIELVRRDALPLIENEYSARFHFDSFDNPKLRELRERYHLDEVVAGGTDEFQKQVLLMDWTHHQFKKFGQPSTPARGALEILAGIRQGHSFFCSQYAEVLVSAAASLGWVDRPLALRRHQGVARVGGSTEHSVTEIWSNQHRKWIMLDPTSNMFLEKEGVPLNAFEIRQEWFYHGGTNLLFVVGKERRAYRKADLPIILATLPGFGDLAIYPDELDKYGFVGYIPNTNLLDGGFDYARMFIFKDALCNGTRWHLRDLPQNPAVDPYFPLGQAVLDFSAGESGVRIGLRTLTPNFARFEARRDQGPWEEVPPQFNWKLTTGSHLVQVRTVNQFGVYGPVSSAELQVAPVR